MKETLGQKIARLRKEKRYSQEDLAKKFNLTTQAVSKWENGGAPDVEMLPEIADYFDVSMDFLSMGMSNDYEDAILEGSNMVRVGTAIFGARNYGQRESVSSCGRPQRVLRG